MAIVHPGQTLRGKYRLRAFSGPHPAGELWTAIDLRFDTTVAVLVVPAAHPRRLQRTATVLERIASDHAQTVLDFEPLPAGHAAVVLPPLTGQPLDAWLPGASAAEVATVAAQLAHGLWPLHARGLIHGALRAEVVRVSAGPVACLYEAGLGHLVREAMPDGSAPPMPSAQADLFALARAIRRHHPELPGALGQALDAASHPDPARRPVDAAAFLAALGHPRPPQPKVAVPPRSVAITVIDNTARRDEPDLAGATLSDRPSEEALDAAVAAAEPVAPAAPSGPLQPVEKRDEMTALPQGEVAAALAAAAPRGGPTEPIPPVPVAPTPPQQVEPVAPPVAPAPPQPWGVISIVVFAVTAALLWMLLQ